MPIHLLKLCVGVGSLADLEERIAARLAVCRAAGSSAEQLHVTRVTPKRLEALLNGGSMYWVVRGHVAARQKLIAARPVVGEDGVPRCQLVLEPIVVPVLSRPCRPFQGWRYLPDEARPPDLADAPAIGVMPEDLRLALRELCLI